MEEIGGRYRIDGPLGTGGMGEVYRGTDLLLGRPVAIKVIRRDRTADEEAARRFLRESRITARLDHPGVPHVYDHGRIDDPGHSAVGRYYLVMQFIDGWSADDLAEQFTPLPVGWAAAIAAQTCAVLHYAHQRLIIHRDLKPGNLMVTRDGFVKVLDFGLATALGDPEQSKISVTGFPFGTWLYMAPEQFGDGKGIGPATDLYALGLVLFRMITGQALFEGRSHAELTRGHVLEEPPKLRTLRREVPQDLEALVADLLAKDPGDRPSSALEVYRRLLPHTNGLPELPGAVDPGLTPIRMYAAVLTPLTVGVQPSPSFTRGDLAAVRRRAAGLSRAGRDQDAVDLLHDAIERARSTLGGDHADVLAAMSEIAGVLKDNGRYAEAAEAYAELGRVHSRRDGPDADETLESRRNEADCLVFSGKQTPALAKLHDLLEDESRVHGASSERVRGLRHRIFLLQKGGGDFTGAAETLKSLLLDTTRELGPDHQQTRSLAHELEVLLRRL